MGKVRLKVIGDETLEQAEKDKQISKDERFKFEKQVDDILNQHKIKIDQLTKNKEQEIMTV